MKCEDCGIELKQPDWVKKDKCPDCERKYYNSIKRAINSVAVGFQLRIEE